jgi:hypothetical protein
MGGAAPAGYHALLAPDASGNSFAAIHAPGEHLLLPGGKTELWSGDDAILKLDAELEVVWSVPISLPATQLVAEGDDVWLLITAGDADIAVGSTTFELTKTPNMYSLVAVKLDGKDGSIVASHELASDWYGGLAPKLVAGPGGAFLTVGVGESVDYLGTASKPPTANEHSALFRLGTAAPRWVPGEVVSLNLDDDQKVVVAVITPGGRSVSFGGDSCKVDFRFGVTAAARYNAGLGHEASFCLTNEPITSTSAVLPLGSDLLFLHGPVDGMEIRDFTGKLLRTTGGGTYDFSPNLAVMSEGMLFTAGFSSGGAKTIQGRQFIDEVGFLHSFDAASGDLRAAFSVPNDGAKAGVTGVAVAPGAESLTVAFGFSGVFEFAGKKWGLPVTRGLALARVKLHPATSAQP